MGVNPPALDGGLRPSDGTFPRILRKYVREDKRLTLEDAIRKFTSLPAQRMRFADRGVLKAGMWADVVVFDPDTATRAPNGSLSPTQGLAVVERNFRWRESGGAARLETRGSGVDPSEIIEPELVLCGKQINDYPVRRGRV